MEDFYFAYGYVPESNKADRLYRFLGGQFERYHLDKSEWSPAPEQCCIFIGEDAYYDEITEEQANEIISELN